MSRWGDRGKDVVRFEWRRYKRLLQVHGGSLNARRKLKPKVFFQAMYRLDEAAKVDWSKVSGLEHVGSNAGPGKPPDRDGGKNRVIVEYMTAVVKPHTFYNVPAAQRGDVGQDVFFSSR